MRSASFLLLLVLSACAVPEDRLRTGLVNAGLPRPLAACMAERMVDRLSLAQLMRLADLPRAREAESVDRFLRRVRALGDPEILSVTSSSAALCATGLAR
ncbi:hypothetical protein OK349_11420 [Sphingomonas sp. BT-65]|uniref:hypothetical protein n=1 Tax=Sphingomonas sp. BT-65 TaxID=2989821 RepID=UPI0022357484|nr:hypothetical protein [Sphingomonas sp. BT-65]MCW4462316.1 hypothetical protein [Sphingomonas sp. BT-65]